MRLSLVPSGECLQIRDRGESGFCIRGNGFWRNHDVQQRGTFSHSASESTGKFADVFDALRIDAESTPYDCIVGKLPLSAYGLSESDHLVVNLDLPCTVVCNDKRAMAHCSIELHRVEAEGAVTNVRHSAYLAPLSTTTRLNVSTMTCGGVS